MFILTTVTGRNRRVPQHLEAISPVGLDPDGRIVVDTFNVLNQSTDKASPSDFLFGLTLCCDAFDKGFEDSIVCRGCYGGKPNADVGSYLYRAASGGFPDLDRRA